MSKKAMAESSSGKIVTQFDVARRAGVTRSVVSYVINNSSRKVSAETRNRVLLAINELGYRPNKHARILNNSDDNPSGNYLGVILAGNYMFRRPYYTSILASMHNRVHELGWQIQFIRVYEDFCDPVLFDQLIHRNEIRGALLIGLNQSFNRTSCGETLIDEIIRRIERVVCIDWSWPGVPSVQFDFQMAAFQATEHLLSQGRKRIAYIGPSDQRIAGYQRALWENGIDPEKNLIYSATEVDMGYKVCTQLLQSGVTFDAVCTGTDEVGIATLHCLNEYGLHVPKDISVASIDNIELSAYTVPSLTTVGVPMGEIGHHGVELLVSDLTWGAASEFTVTVPTQLIVRGSSIVTTS
jgi:LacI family transcriptional regulator